MAKIVPVSDPTYSLATVKALAANPAARRLTVSAETSALSELGMDRAAVFAAVAALTSADFYKTMPSETVEGLAQDVYRPRVVCPSYPEGVSVYCKVQLVGQRVVLNVISFKRK